MPEKKKRSVVVHGAYRGDNFGDTLLMALTCRELRSCGCKVLVSNVCANSMRYVAIDENILVLSNRKEEQESDVLVYGGGGYFGEQPVSPVKWNLRFIKLHLPIGFRFAKRRKGIVFCGVDFGPQCLWLARVLSKKLLNSAVYIGARNAESCAFLSDIGVDNKIFYETADVALLLKQLNVPEIEAAGSYKAENRRVLVHPSYEIERREGRLMAELVRRNFDNKVGIEVALLADRANRNVDKMLEGWSSYLGIPDAQVFPYRGPWETCALIRDSEAVVTNKLHTGIVASAYGKNVISLAKHPKNLRFFNQLGRPELCLLFEGAFEEKFNALLRDLVAGALPAVSVDEDLMTKARDNFRLLGEVLRDQNVGKV